MSKLYWKIFLGFWCTTILMILGTNLVIHELDLAPEKHFAPRHENHREPHAGKLLRYAVRDAINHTEQEVIEQVRKLPQWAIRHLFIIDENNRDILDRPLPKSVKKILPHLEQHHPFHRLEVNGKTSFGRFLVLTDGKEMRMVATPNVDDKSVLWQLFFIKFLPILLVAILISGSICIFMTRYITKPIKVLKEATHRIASGDLSVRVKGAFECRKDDITELGHDFDNMTERLQQGMAEQKRLVKDVSHELRSPLMRLQFALGLAQQRSNGNVDTELNKIKEAADYLNDIISDILSIPVSDKESWDLNDAVDLKVLLETLVDNHKPQAQEKHISLSLDCLKEALVATHGNSLVGVFENILNNALRYTLPDTVINITVEQQADKFIVSIRDQGPGLAEEQLEAIFKPFFRSDEARARSSGGYGLGLAIAQRTVALHGGSINAHNNLKRGLCVTVTLPCGDFT